MEITLTYPKNDTHNTIHHDNYYSKQEFSLVENTRCLHQKDMMRHAYKSRLSCMYVIRLNIGYGVHIFLNIYRKLCTH